MTTQESPSELWTTVNVHTDYYETVQGTSNMAIALSGNSSLSLCLCALTEFDLINSFNQIFSTCHDHLFNIVAMFDQWKLRDRKARSHQYSILYEMHIWKTKGVLAVLVVLVV